MALQFNAELTPEHVSEATRGIYWRQVSKPAVLAGVAGIFLLAQGILWAALPMAHWKLHVMLLLLMALTVGGVAWVAASHFEGLALRNFRRFHGQPASVSLTEEHYAYEASWGRGQIAWGMFHSLWRLPRVWVLLQHRKDGVSVLLPAAGLDEEARAFIARKAAEHGAQVLG